MPKIPGKKYPADWKPPKKDKCIACGGKGKSSRGATCTPCAGTGVVQETNFAGKQMK